MNGTAANERENWMDLVRGGAILAVLAYHASAIAAEFEQMQVPPLLALFNTAFTPLRMPTLMLLSGLLLPRSLAKPAPTFAYGKVSRLLYPMVAWSLIYWILGLLRGSWYQPGLHVESSYLWFLEFLFCYYMVALALGQVLQTRPHLAHATVVAGSLVATLFTAGGSKEQSFALLAAFFFTGSWLASTPRLMAAVLTSRWAWSGVLAVGAVVALSAKGFDVAASTAFAPLTAVAILGLMRVARAVGDRPVGRGLRWVGRNSVVFYVSHFPVMALVLDLTVQSLRLPRSFCITAAFAAALLVGVVLTRYRSRSMAIRRLFQLAPAGPTSTAGGPTRR